MDGAEEELRRRLTSLEKGVFDPGFAGREEEVWARMVALRERTRWLQAESEKLGRQVATGEAAGINEDILRKTKKVSLMIMMRCGWARHTDERQILSDYDAQITHLHKELQQVTQEFREWESASRPN